MSVSQDNLNTSLGPPPLATPITDARGDEFGVPFQHRGSGLASGSLQVGWAGWFSGVWNRLVVLIDAILGRVVIDNVNVTGSTPGANSNTLTFLTGYIPTAADVGNSVRISGGVNVNLGVYKITAQTATTWTLAGGANLTTSAGAGSAITGYMSGNVLTHFGAVPKTSGAGALVESAITDDGNTVTVERTPAGNVQPGLTLKSTGTVSKGRAFRPVSGDLLDISLNLSYDGANFNLDDTTAAGVLIKLSPGAITFYTCAAGANPATARVLLAAQITQALLNTAGVYQVGGTPGLTVTITTAKLTGVGANGSMTFSGGILTAQTPAT